MRLFAPAFALALGTALARLYLAHPPAKIAVDLAQPLAVATNWDFFGLRLWVLLAFVLLLAAALAGSSVRDATSRAAVIAACAAALAAGFFFTPLFSSDVYAYAAYGHMSSVGIDPYAHVALPSNDPLFAAAVWQWGNPLPVCAYGPAFVWIARIAGSAFARFGVAVQLDALRVFSCIALLACGIAIADVRKAATFVLNPVVLWSAVEGHNDTIALAIVFAGIALYRRNAGFGSLLATLGGLVKIPALAIAGGVSLSSEREARLPTYAGSALGIVVCVLASLPWLHGITSGTLAHGHYAPAASLQALTGPYVAAAVALALLVQALRLRADPASAWAAAALAVWVLIPNPYPWYGDWLLAIGIFARNPRLRQTIVMLVAASLLRYIPDAVHALPVGWNAALGALASAPLILLLIPYRDSAIITRS